MLLEAHTDVSAVAVEAQLLLLKHFCVEARVRV